MESKVRIGLDISVIIFMIGTAFNAGVTYDRITQIDNSEHKTEEDVRKLQQDQQPLSERVARMEAILADIRDELRVQNEKRTP